MLTSGHGKMRIPVMILNFGHASQRSDGFEVLDMIPKGSMELKFGHASQRFDGFEFGRTSQRSIEIEFWTCYPEVRWIYEQ